jgi:hypothetical protein
LGFIAGLLLFAVPGVAAEVEIRISVPTSLSNEIFVGLFQSESDWRSPVREAVIDTPQAPLVWEVPPWTYKVACAAAGFGARFVSSFEARTDERVEVTCHLLPSATWRGRVVDEMGEPVAGARIGAIEHFLPSHPFQLPDTGEELVRQGRMAVADEDGKYALSGPQGRKLAVLAMASGRAIGYLPGVLFDDSTGHEVALGPGGDVELSVPERALVEGGFASLYPLRAELPAGMSAELFARLHERGPVRGGETLYWQALPVGEYSVVGKAAARTSLEWGRFQVKPGEHQRQVLDVEASTGPRPSTMFLWSDRGSGDVACRGARGELVLPRLETVASPDGQLLRLEVDDRRELHCRLVQGTDRVTHSFSLPRVDTSPGRPHRLDWSQAVEVGGDLEVPVGIPAPRLGWVEARRCEGLEEPGRAESIGWYPAKIERGRWSASIPAGACLDLDFVVSPFAVVSWAGVNASAGEVLTLPARTLEIAASILLRTVDEEGMALAGVEVQVFPEQHWLEVARQGLTPDDRVEPMVSGVSDKDGWLRLDALRVAEPLFLRLIPASPRVVRFHDPQSFPPGRETQLGDLVLERGARLEIAALEETRDLLVSAEAGVSCGWLYGATITARQLESGGFVVEGLPAGLWTVTARHHGLQRREAAGMPRTVSLSPGEIRGIELEPLDRQILGRVTDAGQGIVADLVFKPRDRRRDSLFAESDEDGRFELRVGATPGLYDAWVTSRDEDVSRLGEAVVVPGLALDPGETVEVALPEGEISGVVTDSSGRPLSGANVSLFGEFADDGEQIGFAERRSESSVDGSFSFGGLAEGIWQISAVAADGKGGGRSLSVVVRLGSDEFLPDVRIVLEETTPFHGRVVDSRGLGVSGVTGFVSGETWRAPVRGDEDGAFSVDLPASGVGWQLDFVLQAPGHGTGTFSGVRPSTTGMMTLELRGEGGRLEVVVELTEEGLASPPPISVLLVSQEGVRLRATLAEGARWSFEPRADGGAFGRLVVPSLAPGLWSVELHSGIVGREPRSLGQVQILEGQTQTLEIPPDLL